MSNVAPHLPPWHHRLRVDYPIGALHLQAQLDFAAPWTVVFGPSGSGKSSLLKAACGLLPATFTRQDLTGPTDLSRTPPHRRSLAYAPQGSVLFPHLTVRQNVDFAVMVRGLPKTTDTDEILTLFSLLPLAHRLPRELSGGERQRVSLARALAVPQPHLILLDEPFTGIDRSLRDRLLPHLAAHLEARKIPVISVTHDVEEALLLDAEVIRMEAGHVTAQGPANQVLADERARALRILLP